MNIYPFPGLSELNKSLAAFIAQKINETLTKNERFTIALSGGNTPKALYELLAQEYVEKIDWKRVHVFFADERYVPFDDDRNNAKMIIEKLLDHVPVPRSQVYIMRTDVSPQQSAAEYENIVHTYFNGQSYTFDMVLLGMGDDGHTLSLFPGTDVVNEQQKWASDVLLKDGNYRITLTSLVVNLADTVIFLVSGKGKAETLNKVLNGPYQPDVLPSQTIKPVSNNLYWFVDEHAAAQLPH